MGASQVRVSKQVPALAPKFNSVHTILSALSSSKDALIFSVTGHFVRAELTSGRFDTSLLKPMSSAFEALCSPLSVKVGSALVVTVDDEAREKLSLEDFPDGSLALVCLERTETTMMCAAIFESRVLLSPEKISALQATVKLIGDSGHSSESANEQVTRVRDFYRRFSESIRQCFWIVDTTTNSVLQVSENFEDVWGSSRAVLNKGGISEFLSNVLSEDRDRVLSDFHNHLETSGQSEFRVLDPDGTVRWIYLRMTRHENELLIVAEDVTDKKQAEESERAKETALVSRARAMAVVDLASGVAHEINNPLTIIVGRASELRRRIVKGEATPELQIEIIEKIQSTAIRIADIIKSLKSLARQDRGGRFAPVEFGMLAREVADLSSERFKNQSVELSIETPPRSLVAEMNPTLISQVVLNLVNNALDAVSALDEKWVRVDFAEDTDSIYIGVTDSGSGIPINIRSRIFDPFFTTKEPGKGTGLGLAISMSIAAHHDGALRLDTLHSHTRFVLQIPKKQARKTA